MDKGQRYRGKQVEMRERTETVGVDREMMRVKRFKDEEGTALRAAAQMSQEAIQGAWENPPESA